MRSGKVVLLQLLEKMPTGSIFFQMKEDEGVELVFKFHLHRPVAPREKRWYFSRILVKGFSSCSNERAEYLNLGQSD